MMYTVAQIVCTVCAEFRSKSQIYTGSDVGFFRPVEAVGAHRHTGAGQKDAVGMNL